MGTCVRGGHDGELNLVFHRRRIGFQISVPPLASEAASLIEQETQKSEYRIMNVECRMSNVEGRNSIDFY